jgi:gliding motility-associated-like protein
MDNNEHNDIRINGKKIESPFTTPEGYFDELKSNILKDTVMTGVKTVKFNYHNLYKIAAVAAVAVAIIGITLLVYKNNHKTNVLPAYAIEENGNETNIETNEIQQPAPEKEVINRNTEKEGYAQNTLETVYEKEENKRQTAFQTNNIVLKEINKPEQPENHHNISNQANSENNKTKTDIAYNTPDNNHLSTGQNPVLTQTAHQSGSTQGGAVVVRKSKHPVTILTLCSDTCSVSPVILSAINNDKAADTLNFVWSNGMKTNSVEIDKPGTYYVTVFRKNSKEPIDSGKVTVKIIDKPDPDLGQDQTICSHESFSIDCKTTGENYHYKWSVGNSDNNKLFIKRLQPGTYTISVTVEACGYSASSQMHLTVNECILQFSNVITPNGDGKNDKFVIKGLEHYPGSALYIIDRNGKTVYESLNYQNNWTGENLPAGTYFYLLRVNDGKNTEKGGSVTIIR